MGVELISEIVLKNGRDYPLVDSNNIRGGLYHVKTTAERNAIPDIRRKEGMVCYVESEYTYYVLHKGNWYKLRFENTNGLPILDLPLIDDLTNKGELPNKYISVPDVDELDGYVSNNIYTTQNGNYIDILFSAIRKLQAEVVKLQNSFRYGINSYNNTQTAISSVYANYSNDADEPLWAVEEEDLSPLYECTIDISEKHNLQGKVIVDEENKILKIPNTAYFEDPEGGFKTLQDPKCFVYLTTNSKEIKFELTNDSDVKLLNLNDFNINTPELLNILFVLSKKTLKTVTDSTLYGENYIWISVSDYKTNKVLISGYYDGTNILSSKLVPIDNIYHINKVIFNNLDLYKFNSYTKFLDFSSQVIPDMPTDLNYKLGVAHLTIRSVQNEGMMNAIKDLLQDNELIWAEGTKNLFIKSKGNIYKVGSNKDDNDTMTTAEFIATLKNLGIVVSGKENDYNIEIANLTGISFIHQATGKKFNIEIDSEGNLRSTLQDDNTIAKRLEGLKLDDIKVNDRGFVSRLRIAEANKMGASLTGESDVRLLSDRIKIGAVYAPLPDRKVFGCSHAYVELENSSDKDLNLLGCYLHAAFVDGPSKTVKTLPLTGTIKAGSTYLIRGKKYTEFNDKNTVIKVKTFDLEWYDNGQLIDFQRPGIHFLLIYDDANPLIDSTYAKEHPTKKKSWEILNNNIIDFAQVRIPDITAWMSEGVFINTDSGTTRDYILRNTYELDPAKQAFLALSESDSSRTRGRGKNDFKPLYIDVDKITFPHSEESYPVSMFTPKASFEHRNIATDKSRLDSDKPNMVYCSFGININTTRCFNWISVGSFDEFIWIRQEGTDTWYKFESYKTLAPEESLEPSINGPFTRKAFNNNIINAIYARMQGRFPGDGSFYTAHKCIISTSAPIGSKKTYEYVVGRLDINGNPDIEHTSKIMKFTMYPENTKPRIFLITDLQGFYWLEYQTWAGSAKAVLAKIEEQLQSELFIPIILNTGDMTQNGTRVNEWIDYYKGGECLFEKYEHMSVVGNNDLCNTDINALGTGDDEGKSNGYFHHLFQCFEVEPDTTLIINGKYVPSTYYIECKIDSSNYERIVCVNSEITFINCRDWFNLSTENPDVAYNIYTGWTAGNSAPVETPKYTSSFTPIYDTLYKWFTQSNRRCIVACHEMPFTVITRLNLSVSTSNLGYSNESRSVDGKVGGKLIGSHLNQITRNDNTAMYWFSRLLESTGVKLCIGGHKHTYTCTYPVREFYFYENGAKNSLINGPMKMGANLSDEYANGKHKITWFYTKLPSDLLFENNNGVFRATGPHTVKYDSFFPDNIKFNTSRLPIVKFSGQMYNVASSTSKSAYSNDNLSKLYLPMIGKSDMTDGVVYFMCLATGYKQTSNKELPGSGLAFTKLLPLTTYNSDSKKDDASVEQQLPMFAIVKYKEKLEVLLLRVINVQAAKKKPLYNNEGEYSTLPVDVEYINGESADYIESRFGIWNKQESNVVVI